MNLVVEVELVQEVSPADCVFLPVQHESVEQTAVLAVRKPGTEVLQDPSELQRGQCPRAITIK